MIHSDQQSEVSALGYSPDALAERKNELLALLRQTAPEIVSDNQIDLERLKELLGQDRIAPAEHYELSWAGKTEARREIQKTTSHTLRPSEGNSEQAPHMLIEGENLEVLRVLQKSYYGKVKMIYIDPPYNTGNDSFVYPDDYSETLDEYQRRTGEKNEAGYLNKQSLWKKNSKESGQYHSAWLSMMYPRLYLARNLLREDGVIFISIDDNEAANLKLLCDEIFGEENFIESFIWVKKTAPNNVVIGSVHEYILVYSKSIELVKLYLLPRSEEQNKDYKNPDNDSRGPWKPDNLTAAAKGGRATPSLIYEVINPNTGQKFYPPEGRMWAVNQDEMAKKIAEGSVYWGKNGDGRPMDKRFLANTRSGSVASTLLVKQGSNSEASKELQKLFGGKVVFETPKPVRLLKHLLQIGSQAEDLVLDFFAGSAATAQAILALNVEDGGNRQLISVQFPELLEENTEAYKAGYRTIADITRARIDKVIEKLKAEHPEKTEDLACAHFTLAPSNFKVWRNDLADADAIRQQLEFFQQTEKTDFDAHANQTAMLTELLLKQGLGALGVHAISKPRTLDCGVTVHRVLMADDSQLWLCFEPYLDALREEIIKAKPAQVIMLNSCFVGEKADEQLSNLQLELVGLDIGLLVI